MEVMPAPMPKQPFMPFDTYGLDGQGFEPEPPLHLTIGKFLMAAGIAFTSLTGCKLYRDGYNDFMVGLSLTGHVESCHWTPVLSALFYIAPLSCVLRSFFAPAVWKFFVERADFSPATGLPAIVVWLVLFLTPFGMVVYLIYFGQGIFQLDDPASTIELWPADCAVDRPYQGLLQTRLWAIFGAYMTEMGWHMMIIMIGETRFSGTGCKRVWTLMMPCMMFSVFMVYHGPLRFLRGYAGAPCDDLSIEYTYVAVCVACFGVHSALIMCLLAKACNHLESPSGPSMHPAAWLWYGILVAQIVLLEYILPQAKEIKPGAPWEACGVDYKEFYFPRHKGMIFYLYSQLLAFPCVLMAAWLWR